VKVREAGAPGARTRFETLVLLGRKPAPVPDETLMDGINAGRKTIPFAAFEKKRKAQGLECLRSYRTEWDEKARAFKLTPAHNWASHGAGGWRYLSISWRAPMREPEPEQKPAGIPLLGLTMDQFMDIEDTARRGRRGSRARRNELEASRDYISSHAPARRGRSSGSRPRRGRVGVPP